MRSTKLAPLGEVCEKKRRRAMARECRRAALESLRLSRSGRRSWRARSPFRTHSVARTRARLLTLLTDALAAAQPVAAEAVGTATSMIRTAATATRGFDKGMHWFSRHSREDL